MELQTFKMKRKNTPNFFSHRFSHNLPQENNPKKYARVDKNTIQYTYMNTERERERVCVTYLPADQVGWIKKLEKMEILLAAQTEEWILMETQLRKVANMGNGGERKGE